jgi:ADP-ribose pyrophosphatase YjhB (NUDIX family)
MCRRAHAPAEGLWVPPSGFVELGETLEAAAAREAAEEAGLEVNVAELIPCAITSLPHLSEIYITFRVAVANPKLTAGAESLEVALFDENNAPWSELAFPGTQAFLRIFFGELRSGQFSLHHTPAILPKPRFRRGLGEDVFEGAGSPRPNSSHAR